MKGILKRTLCYANPVTLGFIGVMFLIIIQSCVNIDEKISPVEAVMNPFMHSVISAFLPLAIIHTETSSGMLKWLMTSPMTAKAYVREKYMVTFCSVLFFSLLSSVEIVIYMNKTSGFDIKQYILMLAVIIGVLSFILCITLPIIIRFGSVTGFAVFTFSLIFMMFLAVIGSLLTKNTEFGIQSAVQVLKTDMLVLAVIIIGAAAVITVISYLIAVRTLKNKQY